MSEKSITFAAAKVNRIMSTIQDIDNLYIPEFEKYLKTLEPSVRERADYWRTAIENGFVRSLYPESPRHPRQKYLLTVKGIVALNQLPGVKK